MQRVRLFLLLLFAAHGTTQAVAGSDARQWLERLAAADNPLAYRGVLIYESGDQTESLRITHGIVDGRPYDHLEHLDGDRREVIRSGSSLTCVHPGQRLTRLLRSQPGGAVDGIESFYTLNLNGESRIAGRPVVLVEAVPRDSFRLGYRFAFDRDTGLPLRYEQVDASQRMLERFQFAEIEISDQLSPQWQLAAADATEKSASAAGKGKQLPTSWLPQWLPPGFAPVLADGNDDGDVQTYSDGLSMLSIFVAEVDQAVDSSGGTARQGATVAHTATLQRGEQAYVVTVIGEVPAITAQRVADAVAWREPAS